MHRQQKNTLKRSGLSPSIFILSKGKGRSDRPPFILFCFFVNPCYLNRQTDGLVRPACLRCAGVYYIGFLLPTVLLKVHRFHSVLSQRANRRTILSGVFAVRGSIPHRFSFAYCSPQSAPFLLCVISTGKPTDLFVRRVCGARERTT